MSHSQAHIAPRLSLSLAALLAAAACTATQDLGSLPKPSDSASSPDSATTVLPDAATSPHTDSAAATTPDAGQGPAADAHVLPLDAGPSAASWTALAPMPTDRIDHGAAVDSAGRLYVVGGINETSGLLSSIEMYLPSRNAWSNLGSLPEERDALSAVMVGDKLYVIGGRIGSPAQPTTSVLIYDVVQGRWTLGPSLPKPRAAGAAALGPDGYLYSFGGNQVGSSDGEVYRCLPGASPWVTLPGRLSSRRASPASAVGPDGTLYVLGGYGSSSTVNTAESLAPSDGAWFTIPSMPTPRSAHVAGFANDHLLHVFGGIGGGSRHDAFNPATQTWSTLAPTPFTTTNAAIVADADKSLYVVGGSAGAANTSHQLWRYRAQ